MTEFQEYAAHGWYLVPIPPGQKGPRTRGWQLKENCVADPERAETLRNAGLAHAYSGTCAIDVDDYPVAAAWLAERGVDLDALFADPESIQLSSGRSNHGKLLYALPEPLASKTVARNKDKKAALDFRCATASGLSVQDVLPPSIHPDTGTPYKWIYGDPLLTDWRTLPEIPEALHKIWLDELSTVNTPESVPDKGAAVDELRMLLKQQDSSMDRDGWIKVGMAVHHECDGSQEGLDLWDEWSRGSDKYVSYGDLQVCWRSFHDTPNAVTVGFLRQGVVATADEFESVSGDAPEEDPWEAVDKKRRERFELVHVAEVAKRDPPEWLVDGIIPQADLAMLYGAPGAGKSFVALDLAFSVANGFVWFNRKSQQGSVVWIAAEAVGAMRNRARAYAQARGVTLENSDLWIIEQTLSLMDEHDTNALVHVLRDISPRLIIVDTLAAASGGANENSGEDMNIVLSNCRKLHEATGALILLIHHTGKDVSRGARGWSGIKAAMHTELLIQHSEDSSLRIMKSTKQRDAVDGERFPFKLQIVSIDFDSDMTSCVIDPLDQSVLIGGSRKLGANQQLVFDAVCSLSKTMAGDETILLQDAYDIAVPQLPQPMAGSRDTRPQAVQRTLAKLHELGYVTISGDHLTIGSSIDD